MYSLLHWLAIFERPELHCVCLLCHLKDRHGNTNHKHKDDHTNQALELAPVRTPSLFPARRNHHGRSVFWGVLICWRFCVGVLCHGGGRIGLRTDKKQRHGGIQNKPQTPNSSIESGHCFGAGFRFLADESPRHNNTLHIGAVPCVFRDRPIEPNGTSRPTDR